MLLCWQSNMQNKQSFEKKTLCKLYLESAGDNDLRKKLNVSIELVGLVG